MRIAVVGQEGQGPGGVGEAGGCKTVGNEAVAAEESFRLASAEDVGGQFNALGTYCVDANVVKCLNFL